MQRSVVHVLQMVQTVWRQSVGPPSHMRACALGRFAVRLAVMAINGIGRPHAFDPAMGDAICDAITEGKSLRAICREPDMPSIGTVLRWVAEGGRPEERGSDGKQSALAIFREQYLRARQEQADVLADEVIDIADRATDPQLARLQIDSRKWYAGKVRPKVYGEGIALKHSGADGDGPVQVDVTAKSALVDGLLAAIAKPEAQD